MEISISFCKEGLRSGFWLLSISCNCILVFFLRVIILFPNATLKKMLTGDELSHIVFVIVDYGGVFIKGHSQAICMFLFAYVLSMFVKVQID